MHISGKSIPLSIEIVTKSVNGVIFTLFPPPSRKPRLRPPELPCRPGAAAAGRSFSRLLDRRAAGVASTLMVVRPHLPTIKMDGSGTGNLTFSIVPYPVSCFLRNRFHQGAPALPRFPGGHPAGLQTGRKSNLHPRILGSYLIDT